jgi:hypothetical protein
VKGDAPEGGSWSCVAIVILGPISWERRTGELTGVVEGFARVYELIVSFITLSGA